MRDVLLHGFFLQLLDLLLLLLSDLLLDVIKSLLLFGRKLLNSQSFDVGSINITRFRNFTGHGSRLILSPAESPKSMLTPFRINTQTHSNVRREEAARCSASCIDRSDRSLGAVRPVAVGRTVMKPTNVSPGRPVGAGARRVVLGSAGQLERPQST